MKSTVILLLSTLSLFAQDYEKKRSKIGSPATSSNTQFTGDVTSNPHGHISASIGLKMEKSAFIGTFLTITFAKSGAHEVKLETDDFKITIKVNAESTRSGSPSLPFNLLYTASIISEPMQETVSPAKRLAKSKNK